jgi:hypothetical protein
VGLLSLPGLNQAPLRKKRSECLDFGFFGKKTVYDGKISVMQVQIGYRLGKKEFTSIFNERYYYVLQ